jgi:hypothetical protein
MTAPEKPPGDVRWWDGERWVWNGKVLPHDGQISVRVHAVDYLSDYFIVPRADWLALPKDKPNVL